MTCNFSSPPNEIGFYILDKWCIKITDEGIKFNRKDFSNFTEDEFADTILDILEKNFTVNFTKKPKDNQDEQSTIR